MEKKVLEIINTVLNNKQKSELEELIYSLDLRKDIGFDSLDLAELTVRIEAEYDIDIFEDGLVNTIEEVLDKLKGL
ncbi:MAG: acyl carrier protein [Ignavibacteria bacterium]|nr:acyl carrier protein [Ignavibacteria bacterium]